MRREFVQPCAGQKKASLHYNTAHIHLKPTSMCGVNVVGGGGGVFER